MYFQSTGLGKFIYIYMSGIHYQNVLAASSKSSVECWLIALINPQSRLRSALNRHPDQCTWSTLDWHLIDILIDTRSMLVQQSVNSWPSVDQFIELYALIENCSKGCLDVWLLLAPNLHAMSMNVIITWIFKTLKSWDIRHITISGFS